MADADADASPTFGLSVLSPLLSPLLCSLFPCPVLDLVLPDLVVDLVPLIRHPEAGVPPARLSRTDLRRLLLSGDLGVS